MNPDKMANIKRARAHLEKADRFVLVWWDGNWKGVCAGGFANDEERERMLKHAADAVYAQRHLGEVVTQCDDER